MEKKKKRGNFNSENLEIIRRDNKGKRIFQMKGKPRDIMEVYTSKFSDIGIKKFKDKKLKIL